MTAPVVGGQNRLRVDALTGLRWFAAIAVFFHHAAPHEWLPDPIARIMQAGSNGVTFFFVLSGFVIALNYFDDAASPALRGTWNYAVGRLARVYPLYLLVLVTVWLTFGDRGDPYRFVLHVFAVQTWHPDLYIAYGLNAPGWSIGVEFFLYACFPLLALLLRPIARKPRALLAVAAGLVILVFTAAILFEIYRSGLPPTNPFSAHRWLYRTPATRLADFTVGMIAALLVRHALRTSSVSVVRNRLLSPLLTWLPLTVTLLLMAWPDRPRYYASLDAMWIVPAVMLCVGLSLYPGSLLSRALSLRWVVLLGEVSFAFYLVHRPLMFLFDAGSSDTDSLAGYLLKMIGMVVLITVVAAACHFLVERPAQRLINRWLRIRVSSAARPVAAPLLAERSGA